MQIDLTNCRSSDKELWSRDLKSSYLTDKFHTNEKERERETEKKKKGEKNEFISLSLTITKYLTINYVLQYRTREKFKFSFR